MRVVVGASHGGFEDVRGLLNTAPDTHIQWYAIGDFLPFLSGGMQLLLERTFKDADSVHYATPKALEAKGVLVVLNSTTISAIAPDSHSVRVVDHVTGAKRDERYHKLLLIPGALTITLSVDGKDLAWIATMLGHNWAIQLKESVPDPSISSVTTIGAGYIQPRIRRSFYQSRWTMPLT